MEMKNIETQTNKTQHPLELCVHCKKKIRITKSGEEELLTLKYGYYVHCGCRNKNLSIPEEDLISKYGVKQDYSTTDLTKYDIVNITLSDLFLLSSDEEYNDHNYEKIDEGEPYRKLQLLIITNLNGDKYYSVICLRTVYISTINLSRSQINNGSHYDITWSGLINEMLYYGPVECFPQSRAHGWDYNHIRNITLIGNSIVPLKYIYKNITDIILNRSS